MVLAGIFKIICLVQTVSESVFSLSDDVFSKATCKRKYGLCGETFANTNTGNGSASTSEYCHRLRPLRMSDFFSDINCLMERWLCQYLLLSYFRDREAKIGWKEKKSGIESKNPDLILSPLLMHPLLPPLRGVTCATVLHSGALLVFLTLHRPSHQR